MCCATTVWMLSGPDADSFKRPNGACTEGATVVFSTGDRERWAASAIGECALAARVRVSVSTFVRAPAARAEGSGREWRSSGAVWLV